MLKQLRHKRKVKRNLRLVKRYYGVSVSKHPKRAYQR